MYDDSARRILFYRVIDDRSETVLGQIDAASGSRLRRSSGFADYVAVDCGCPATQYVDAIAAATDCETANYNPPAQNRDWRRCRDRAYDLGGSLTIDRQSRAFHSEYNVLTTNAFHQESVTRFHPLDGGSNRVPLVAVNLERLRCGDG